MTRLSRLVLASSAFAAVGTLSGSANAALSVDTTLLNNTTNVVAYGDDAPGVTNGASASSNLNNDKPQKAFGQAGGGGYETGTFLFGDAGNTTGTINTLSFTTTSPVFLYGLELTGGAAGPSVGDPRRIGRVYVYTGADTSTNSIATVANFPDTGDGGPGVYDLIFNAPVLASSFTLALTNQDTNGLRVAEIDAIVPEPASLSLLGMGGLGLLARRRRD